MADTELIHTILQSEQVLLVNGTRNSYDLHRVQEPFLTEFTNALNEAKQWNSAAIFAAGDQAGAQQRVAQARERLAGLLRNGYFHILSVPVDDLPEADRIDAQLSYGWEQGQMGELEPVERIESLAGLSVSAGPLVHPAARYPAPLVSRIGNWLGILTGNKEVASGGTRETVTEQKDSAREALVRKLSRVRYYYCFASDLGEGNPELARIGFQPKRRPGEAEPQPLPAAPGTAVWEAAERMLTVPEMPAHATFLVAWRQPLGGEAEEAGVSNTPTVLASQFSPFEPGATYDLWVTGRNSRGDGPASPKVRWVATA